MGKKFLSRKFILTVLFAAIVCLNYWEFNGAIAWEALLSLAVVFGIYSGANAYQSASNEPSTMITKYESPDYHRYSETGTTVEVE